jgi:hypothetical protein
MYRRILLLVTILFIANISDAGNLYSRRERKQMVHHWSKSKRPKYKKMYKKYPIQIRCPKSVDGSTLGIIDWR